MKIDDLLKDLQRNVDELQQQFNEYQKRLKSIIILTTEMTQSLHSEEK